MRKVLSRTKDNPDAYKNLALIYYDQGNYRLAEFISANAQKLDAEEESRAIYNNLGMIYLKLDERARALAQFQKAVSLDPQLRPGAHEHRRDGAGLPRLRDRREVLRQGGGARSRPRTRATSTTRYALDGQKGRDPKKGLAAAAQFEKVLQLKPDQPEAICGAGLGLRRRQDRLGEGGPLPREVQGRSPPIPCSSS